MAVEVFEDEGGGFRFRIKAANGEIQATSESYTRKEDAERGYRDFLNVVSEGDEDGD